VANAYFHHRGHERDTASYEADAATGGPWAPHLQHGGPPAALLVAEAERCAERETGRTDLVALRIAAEFAGPVPVGDLTVRTRVVRAARTAVLVDAVLAAGGRDCLTGRVWLLGRRDTADVAAPAHPLRPPNDGGDSGFASFPYAQSLDWVLVRGGGLSEPGPGAVWARARRPIVADRAMTSLQFAALVGDTASGLSSELDIAEWTFLNIDLDIHLLRPVAGDWILVDAATEIGPTGAGLARSTLSDEAGSVGGTLQTLLIAPRES